MRSVLVATDLIRKTDGTWTPTEINTNSSHELSVKYFDENGQTLPVVDFILNFGDFFNHIEFDSFLKTNGFTKIVVIDVPGNIDTIFKSFAHYYNYQFELVGAVEGSLTIPVVEDSDDKLIIRVAYDTYALVDDVYARDMYEFHNLIKDETFASPVTFNIELGPNLDTIVDFEPSIDGIVPNYMVKPRLPGYPRGLYPKVYRLDTAEELNQLKNSLSDKEFIQKYEYHPELSTVNNRVSFIRSLDLIYGPNLDVLNIITYKSINSVSTQNTLLRYDSELLSDKRLDPMFTSKWHPKYHLLNDKLYHFDETDMILLPDLTDVPAISLGIGNFIQGIKFTQDIMDLRTGVITDLDSFTTGPVEIGVIVKNNYKCIFVNISAVDENDVEYSWYDGIDNKYLTQKSGSTEVGYISQTSGSIEVGDTIFVFNKTLNKVNPLVVTSIHYDIKDLKTYKISLEKDTKEFFIKLDNDNYLIQHNFGQCNAGCGTQFFCETTTTFGTYLCDACGKDSIGCPNCTGQPDPMGYVCNSDRNLKENLTLIGQSSNGINIYQFNYIGDDVRYEGVMAQELLGTIYEDAVIMGDDGYYKVNYNKIDVEFKKLS